MVQPSRRAVLWAGVTSPALACARRKRASSSAGAAPSPPPSPPPPDEWGGLTVAKVGTMRDDERGGTAVVLLHGWGAAGDDLVGLAHELQHPRSRFFVPAAPLPEVGGGRAWWHFDRGDRPEHAWDDRAPARAPHPALAASRAAVQAVLRTVRQRYAPERLCLAGFSQGAMLSLDVALAADPAVDRVAVLSGILLVDSLPGLRAARPPRPPVFISHGRHDPVLPFAGSERARDMLQRHGFDVSFHPFEGGHEIPGVIIGALAEFLFA